MMAAGLLQWLLGALVGSMLFFAAVVTPSVFRALPADAAATYLRRLFPLYYLWGLVSSLACSSTAFIAGDSIAGVICALVALLFVYVRLLLLPRIDAQREGRRQGDPEATGQTARKPEPSPR